MKKLIGLALLASTAAVGVASAEEGSFSGNIALGTDYVFRGQSQTQSAPAVSGGFDYTHGMFYVGTWASSIDFGNAGPVSVDAPLELDLYAGIKPVTGPVTWDLGIVGYFYPGAEDPAGVDFDYWEVKVAPSFTPTEGLTLGAALFYSPEFTLSDDGGIYYEANAAFTISDMFSVSGAVGHQEVDQSGYFILDDGSTADAYTTWNVGGTASVAGFGVDLRYHDADEDITNFAGEVVSDERVVLTLKRVL